MVLLYCRNALYGLYISFSFSFPFLNQILEYLQHKMASKADFPQDKQETDNGQGYIFKRYYKSFTLRVVLTDTQYHETTPHPATS